MLIFALVDQETGSLGNEERAKKQNGSREELDEGGELPLESVGLQGCLDTEVNPESSKRTDLDENIEETDQTTSNGSGGELGKVDRDDQG